MVSTGVCRRTGGAAEGFPHPFLGHDDPENSTVQLWLVHCSPALVARKSAVAVDVQNPMLPPLPGT